MGGAGGGGGGERKDGIVRASHLVSMPTSSIFSLHWSCHSCQVRDAYVCTTVAGKASIFSCYFPFFLSMRTAYYITLDRPLSLGEVGPTCCARRTYVHCTLPNNLDWQCLRVTCGTCSQPIGWVPMFVIYAHSFCAIKNEKKRKRGKKRILYHVFFLLLFTIMYCAWCQARVTLSRTCPIAPHIDAR